MKAEKFIYCTNVQFFHVYNDLNNILDEPKLYKTKDLIKMKKIITKQNNKIIHNVDTPNINLDWMTMIHILNEIFF